MKTHESKAWFKSYHDDTEDENLLQESGAIALPNDVQATEPPRIRHKIIGSLKRTKDWIVSAINPPLLGGILAVCFGLIPWFHTELFGSGILSPYVCDRYPSDTISSGFRVRISDSINNVGKLFSALQMLIRG
jgi:hypothetical protein